MIKAVFFGVTAGTLFMCGCFRTQLVTVDVIPADARIIANGVAYDNMSPIFIEAPRAKQLAITAYKEGYRDKLYVVDYSLSRLGRIEAWTSIFLFPAIGLCFDNAWQLNENNITINLEPITPEARKEAESASPRVIPISGNTLGVDQTTDPNAKKIFNQL